MTPVATYAGARVFDGHSIRDGLTLRVDGAHFSEISQTGFKTEASVSLEGHLVVPGFVDLQVNGGGGVLLNNAPTHAGLTEIFSAHRRFGTTSMLPTLISDEFPVMQRVASAVRQALAQNTPGIIGVHFEGPHLSSPRRGLHQERFLARVSSETLDLFTSKGLGQVVVTAAPEIMAPDTVRSLAAAGVLVSIGHSAADYDCAKAALIAGARAFTHLFNAMTPLGSRAAGVVGAALEDRESYCSVIVDGHHVSPAALRIAIAAKPRGKVFLVTDAMPSVGAKHKPFSIQGEAIRVEAGRCTTRRGSLAGSDLDMIQAVRNCVDLLGLELEEALRMASLYPAELLADSTRGRIQPGCRADFAVLTDQLDVAGSCVGGHFEWYGSGKVGPRVGV